MWKMIRGFGNVLAFLVIHSFEDGILLYAIIDFSFARTSKDVKDLSSSRGTVRHLVDNRDRRVNYLTHHFNPHHTISSSPLTLPPRSPTSKRA